MKNQIAAISVVKQLKTEDPMLESKCEELGKLANTREIRVLKTAQYSRNVKTEMKCLFSTPQGKYNRYSQKARRAVVEQTTLRCAIVGQLQRAQRTRP